MTGSACSTPASFYTANGSASRPSTAASSPAQAAPCPYREARRLPRELKEHCQIFLEEQLYTCAINLLSSALGAGASRSAAAPPPVAVPPPSHLALLGTLVVHPQHTTRADRPDLVAVSALALDYLRSLVAAVGPVGAGLRAAFAFCPGPGWSGRPGHASDSDASDADSDRDHDGLRGRMANEASLWTRGQDLWSVVGWAFNTAALYPRRWRYWRAWLGLMLDVLDADWAERERLDLEAHEANGRVGPEPTAYRRESMMLMYMDQRDGRHAGVKHIVKALLADGGSLSLSSFPEVFDKEPRGINKASRKRKRDQVLDVDKGKFGDYLDDDSISSGVSEPPTPQKARDPPKKTSFACSNPGLAESAALRLRFFRLLSAATFALRKRSELNQLYEDFAAAVKLLPLPMFGLLVSQRENPLLPAAHVTLLKQLFHLLLPSRYRDPRSVDAEGDAQGSLTMAMLEHCYMASPANTVGLDDNAKLSLVVESAMQLLWIGDMVVYTDSFADAALRGVRAREAKAKKKRTGKVRADAGDALAQEVLAASGQRIGVLLGALEVSTGAAD